MVNKNRYYRRSKISEAKFRELVRYFAADLDATQIAQLSGLNRNTVNRYLKAIRERIAEYCEFESPVSGEIEVDESFFGEQLRLTIETVKERQEGELINNKEYSWSRWITAGRCCWMVPNRCRTCGLT